MRDPRHAGHIPQVHPRHQSGPGRQASGSDRRRDRVGGTPTDPPNAKLPQELTVAGGSPRITAYDVDGNSGSGPPLTYVVDGNQVLVLADLPLAQDGDEIHFGLYMLCHTSSSSGESPKMSDSSRKIVVTGMPIQPGKKILRPMDHSSSFLVDGTYGTYGTDTLQHVLADERNITVPYNALELDGYQLDPQATRKWPYIQAKTAGAVARITASKAGRYHVGFMMYDDRADERVVLSVGGKLRGVAVARLGTRRTWLYWLQDAIDFAGGETIELKGLVALRNRNEENLCGTAYLLAVMESQIGSHC